MQGVEGGAAVRLEPMYLVVFGHVTEPPVAAGFGQ
ncbi:hypothetical protein ANO14919_042010 [Xylariales sp. No.14919]|nr:hypothetical protein ANO14919_042010 [Xylariales sp. No.14919]